MLSRLKSSFKVSITIQYLAFVNKREIDNVVTFYTIFFFGPSEQEQKQETNWELPQRH